MFDLTNFDSESMFFNIQIIHLILFSNLKSIEVIFLSKMKYISIYSLVITVYIIYICNINFFSNYIPILK